MKSKCYNCNKETEYIITTENKKSVVPCKGRYINYTAKVPVCIECKQPMLVRSVEDENIDNLAAAARYCVNGGGA